MYVHHYLPYLPTRSCHDHQDIASDERTESEERELTALLALEEEAGDSPDWECGVTLIHDLYFPEYAREIAEDLQGADFFGSWPGNCIDWDYAARELQHDYMSVDYMGQTFWIEA